MKTVAAAALPRRKAGAPPPEPESPRAEEPAALLELDPLIHERTRLAILTALATADDHAAGFLDLRDGLHLTDGNLMTHLRTLEQGGLIQRNKTGAGRGSSTTVQWTPKGERAFRVYLDRLEVLIHAARGHGEGAR